MGELILSEIVGRVGIATFNRPKARNALSRGLVAELEDVLMAFEADDQVGVIVITGGDSVFSAGADIKEMTEKSFAEAYLENFVTDWDVIPKCRKPTIAAVNGLAFGGGCEFALSCDMIIADENARFAQPEVKVGTLPGAGGTQRWARCVGKGTAMDICMTGRVVLVGEAKALGIVQRIAPPGLAVAAAIKIGEQIASYSRPFVMMIKESVDRAFETSLQEGLLFERRMLHSGFALEDQKEAMKAFAERRAPVIRNR